MSGSGGQNGGQDGSPNGGNPQPDANQVATARAAVANAARQMEDAFSGILGQFESA